MAPVMTGRPPVPTTPAAAIAALNAHLPMVLEGRALEYLGWQRPTPLSLLIPVEGIRDGCTSDPYLLRLGFTCYPDWPPSTQFVNPSTLAYEYPRDVKYLPRIEGTNEISVHAQFGALPIQVVCCSATLEFYEVGHGVEDRHLWDPAVHNFAATLNAVRRGLRPPFYKGVQAT